MTTLEQLGAESNVLLTTYRKDGRAVSTPLWVVPTARAGVLDADRTGKLKRSATTAGSRCSLRLPRQPHGEPLEAHATIGDAATGCGSAESERSTAWSAAILIGSGCGPSAVLVS